MASVEVAAVSTGKGKGCPPPPKGLGKGPPMPAGGKGGATPKGGSTPRCVETHSGPKLRPLFWTTIREMPKESIWSDLAEPANIDREEVERIFALAQARTPRAKDGSTTPRGEQKRIRVLDTSASQNLAIAFNKLPDPKTFATVVSTLEDFPECLPPAAVVALASCLTEQKEAIEQIKQMCTGEAELEKLDMPERYLAELGRIPFCTVKFACGGLLIGRATELGELRKAGEKMGKCCQALRKSAMLQKCVSTALSVGNILNRGTNRVSSAVVLPDSLLKFEELRGSQGEDKGQSAKSLLDIVVQAVADDGGGDLETLRQQAATLLALTKDAQTVCLEDVESSCRTIAGEIKVVKQGLSEVQAAEPSRHVDGLITKMERISKEADLAQKLTEFAKVELGRTQRWSSAKKEVKCGEWLLGWRQFLDQLSKAFARAQPPLVRRNTCPAVCLREVNGSDSTRVKPAKLPLVAVQLDDEARIEGLNSFAMPINAGFNDKENAISH